MLDSLLQYIAREKLFHIKEKILLAVSGGLDSVVMAELFHRAGFTFAIAHCNFQLRGDESDRDELFVRSLADKYGVLLFVEHFNTTSYARKNKLSIQVAARNLRYDWFEKLLSGEGYDYIATAHHLDDQSETFLINLARGTGIAGLHGILPKQGRLIRPMLFAYRSDIEQFANDNGLDFVEDSSNASDKYTRNRVRHKIIPQLEKINPSFRQEMGETIRKIREVELIYRTVVSEEKKKLLEPAGNGYQISIQKIKLLKPTGTWLYELLADFGFSNRVVEDIYGSLDEQPGKVFYSPTHKLVKDRSHLLIDLKPEEDMRSACFEVYPAGRPDLPIRLEFREMERESAEILPDPAIAFLDYDKLQFPLAIRKWRRGDYFFPLGMKNKRKLSDFFTDLKFSIPQKENTWLLCSGDDIAWIVGVRLDERYKVTPGTKTVLEARLIQ